MCASSFNSVCIAQSQKAIKLYDDAVSSYLEHDCDRAIALATEALLLLPDYCWAYHVRSMSHLEMGELPKALADANLAVKFGGPDALLLNGRAWVQYNRHEWTFMLNDANKALGLDARNPRLAITRATAFCGLRQFDRAMKDIDLALQLDSHYSRAYSSRAYIRAYQCKYGEAIADYEKALTFDGCNTYALTRFARLLATCTDDSIRDGDRAIKLAKKACELTKWREWGSLSALAAAYGENGRFVEAVKYEEMAQGFCHDETALFIGRDALQGYKKNRATRENPWCDP